MERALQIYIRARQAIGKLLTTQQEWQLVRLQATQTR